MDHTHSNPHPSQIRDIHVSDPREPSESAISEGTFLSELLMNSKKHLKIRTRPDSARGSHSHSHSQSNHGSQSHTHAQMDWLQHAVKEFEHDVRHHALFGTCLALPKEKQMSLAHHLKEKLAHLRSTFLEEVERLSPS